ncbi:MAG: polysaccharide deacetylase family protein [Lentisphaeria bacterium]|nr:polysaccharide deacetylase family protein [Lentisphaeria bacterium]NLZ61025.1 polysaccharide deacetylase family protein [Lentisphaerota bacterium]
MMQDKRFDVILGIDMETDIGSYTDRYEGVRHGTPKLLDLLRRQQAQATFFWTGHAAVNNPETLRASEREGHETGCHGLYHETLGDPLFPLPNNWPVCSFEVEGRIREGTRLVAEVAAKTPRSFRCPRLWGSNTVVQVLEKLGYLADASLPLFFYRTMLSAYHPDPEDWTRAGNMKLLEIPNFCDLEMESEDPWNRDRDQWPLFRTEGSEFLLNKIRSFIKYVEARGVRPLLCFYFHPWEFHEMPQGALDFGEAWVTPKPFITKNCGAVALQEFEKLLQGLKQLGGGFKTCEQLALQYAANK